MTSHSEAPNRGKCMPASARRYCPVMVQVHSLWMPFNLLHSVHEESAPEPARGV